MFDLIIIGGSAAATTAAIYGVRRGLKLKLIAKDFGGEVATSGDIGNWPGDRMTDGITLAGKFKDHLKQYNVDMEEGVEVNKIGKQDDGTFCISAKTHSGSEKAADRMPNGGDNALKCDYTAKTVIVATGVHPRELTIPGEKEYRNKGVSYCSTCDMPLFTGKTVAIIGGGNSALESGLMALDIAKKAYIINKNSQFKGDEIMLKKLESNPDKIEIIYEAKTKEVIGDKFVSALKYSDKNSQDQELKVEGIFVHIGVVPNSYIVPDDVEKNSLNEIVINRRCETNIPGLYAAGDVTDTPFRQIVIAAGEGSKTALRVAEHLSKVPHSKTSNIHEG